MAGALHIVIRRYSWDYDIRAFSQLLGASQHDFRVPVIVLDRALDFDLTSFKLADVSHFLYIGREYNHGEGAAFCFFAKGQECRAAAALFDVHHRADDALVGAHMSARVSKR